MQRKQFPKINELMRIASPDIQIWIDNYKSEPAMMSVNNICIVELFSRQLQRQGRERKKGLTSQTSNRTSQFDLRYRVANIGYQQTLPSPFQHVIVESHNSL